MNRRRQSAVHLPSGSQQPSQASSNSGFKGLLAALMPKKLLHSVSENAKIRTASPKRAEAASVLSADKHSSMMQDGTISTSSGRRHSLGASSNKIPRYSSSNNNSNNKEQQDVDLSGLGLKSSKGLTLFGNVKKPEQIECVKLDHNRFENLPDDLCRCLQLRVLSAAGNDLISVPNWIASLISLNELDLRKNSIQALPESFKCLKRLSVLNLSFNPLTSIDHSLVHCSNLSVLYLNDCCLQFLPATIGRLHHLQVLELRNNSLQSLPSGLCRLGRLECLDVGGNRLTEFPDTLGGLANLKVLLADENRIVKLPQNLDGLYSLEFFDMSNNALRELSPSMDRLTALETFLASDNQLANLPSTFGDLRNLRLLRMDRNGLRQLPSAFGKLHLKEFSAMGNELPELPCTFYQLCKLEVLFLDQNRLQFLPEQFGDLRNLSILSLRGNKIEVLPTTMGNLGRLVTLDLRENRLHSLPTGLRDLNSLRALWLSHNQATPKLNLNCDIDSSTHQKVLTCYLLPQQNQPSSSMSSKNHRDPFDSARQPSKTKRITFELDDNKKQQPLSKQPSIENSDSKDSKVVERHSAPPAPPPQQMTGLRRFPLETQQALEILDAQHEVVVRTETSFGTLVRQARVVRTGKISPRLLYQLDKIKNEQRRSIMFQSSAITIVRNHLETSSSVRNDNFDGNEKPTLFRPPSLIRPYAMIDLKTLQAQVEAERHNYRSSSSASSSIQNTYGGASISMSSISSSAKAASASHHEYEAIFDFKKQKQKNMSSKAAAMVKNDFQQSMVVQQDQGYQRQHVAAARYNSCFSTVAEETNQGTDLNRSF